MAAPTVRGSGALGSGTTSCVIPVPTGGSAPQAGDAMYIVLESSDSTTAAGTPTTPAGWFKLFENTIGGGATNVTTLTVFGKIAGASESDVTVDGVGDHCAGAMIVIAGHSLASITDTVVGAPANHGTGTANLLAPSITVQADSLVLTIMGLSDDAGDLTNASGFANANLADIVEQTDRTVNTGAGGGVAIYTSTCAGTTTGDSEWDHDTAVNAQSVQLGIPPAAPVATGDLAATDAPDTAALAGGVLVEGALSAADAPDALTASGTVAVTGDLAATDALDTLAASGSVGDSAITGDLVATEVGDSPSVSGSVLVSGDLSATGVPDTLAATGTVSDPAITGDLAITEGIDALAAIGAVLIDGSLISIDSLDIMAAAGQAGGAATERVFLYVD